MTKFYEDDDDDDDDDEKLFKEGDEWKDSRRGRAAP